MSLAEKVRIATDCQTGQDANTRDDCRILGYVNSVQAYWSNYFTKSGETYEPVDTVLFTEVTSTGCGTASAAIASSAMRLKNEALI